MTDGGVDAGIGAPGPPASTASARTVRVAVGLLAALAAGAAVWFAGIGFDRIQDRHPAQAELQPGPVDVGFAQAMSVHHQQAIAMAQMLLDGRPTPLASLARSIVYAQLVELGEMRGWLRLWGRPWQPPSRSMDWMLQGDVAPDAALEQYILDCRRSPAGMAGMATDAELADLRRLDGRGRDELFLRLMLRHHQGGIPMARFAARAARLAPVRALARNMVVDQSEEVRRMMMTLAAMGLPPSG